MTVVFRKYGRGEKRPEEREPIACVVSHPDAVAERGPCQREAVGEVWGLPFCELHGREEELAARDEMASSLEGIFTGLRAVEQERHDRNEAAVKIIEEASSGLTSDTLAYEEAMLAAYPPDALEGNTDADTLRYDFGVAKLGMDTPHDWGCEAQIMACRFMRQAHDRGLLGLLEDLEYVRERATVQRLLADRYMDRRLGPARV